MKIGKGLVFCCILVSSCGSGDIENKSSALEEEEQIQPRAAEQTRKPVEVAVDCYKSYPTFINAQLPFSTNCKVDVKALKGLPTRVTWEKADEKCLATSGSDQVFTVSGDVSYDLTINFEPGANCGRLKVAEDDAASFYVELGFTTDWNRPRG